MFPPRTFLKITDQWRVGLATIRIAQLVPTTRILRNTTSFSHTHSLLSLPFSSHHDACILYTTAGTDTSQPVAQRHAIHYHSTYDNKTLRLFRGHTDVVQSLSLSPVDDSFLSSSRDGKVRLWNLQQAGCLAECALPPQTTIPGSQLAAFDATGLVFGIAAAMANGAGYHVHLYDARNHRTGAFAEMKVLHSSVESQLTFSSSSAVPMQWTSFAFNRAGDQLLVGTDGGLAVMLDGFQGTVQRVVGTPQQTPAVACYTNSDKSVLIGRSTGTIEAWDPSTGQATNVYKGHLSGVSCIASNPRYAQFASADQDLCLWQV